MVLERPKVKQVFAWFQSRFLLKRTAFSSRLTFYKRDYTRKDAMSRLASMGKLEAWLTTLGSLSEQLVETKLPSRAQLQFVTN